MAFTLKYGIYICIWDLQWDLHFNMEFTLKYGIFIEIWKFRFEYGIYI